MKKLLAFSSCLLVSLAANNAIAQTQQWWDNSGTGTPTSGTWDTTTTNWANSATLTSSTVTFANNNFPIFAAGSGTITALTITVPGPVTCEGIGNGTTDVGVASGAAVTALTLSGTGPITLPTGAWSFECGVAGNLMYINVPITGSGGIAQHNNGALALYGNNNYSGGTQATGGQSIYYNNNNAFGTGAISTSGGSTSFLTTNASVVTLANAFNINSGTTIVNFGDGNTICSGPWTLGVTPQLKNNHATQPLTISGPISGAFGLQLQNNNATSVGAGTITLSGANTYTGATGVGAGAVGGITTVSVSSINSVSSPAQQASTSLGVPSSVANGTIGIGNTSYGCALIYTGSGETSDRVINLAGTTGAVTIEMDGTGPLVLTSPLTATGAGSKTLTLQGSSTAANTLGAIPNNSSGNKTSLTKAQAGAWYLGGVNTFTGNITVSAGTLGISGSGSLGSGTYAGTIANSGVFVYNSSANQTLSGVISGAGTLTNIGSGALTLTATESMSGAMTVTSGGLNIGNGTTSGNLSGNVSTAANGLLVWNPASSGSVSYSKVISGAGNLTKNGAGTLVIGGNANSFTYGGGAMPAVIINGGILQTGGDQTTGGKAANLGTTPSSAQANNIEIATGATLQGNNPNFAFMGNRGITLIGTPGQTAGLSCITNGNGQLPVQGEMGIQGVISDGGAGIGITITGQTNITTHLVSGVYLEGINTYSGPTIIQSGILSLYYSGAIGNSSSIAISNGASLDVSSNYATTWTLNQPLTANGSGLGWPGYETLAPSSAAILIGYNGGTVDFQNESLYLTITPTNFTGEAAQPALYVSQGNLNMNGNSVYVTNNGASPLGAGVYTLIQLAPGNTISASSAPTLGGGTVYGNGIAGGAASLVVNGGALNLVVSPGAGSTPYFFNLALTPATFVYASASSVTVTGTVSNTVNGVAASPDSVSVSIGGLGTQSTSTFDASGNFTVIYPLPAITPAGYTPASNYVVVCTYTGTLGSATDTSAVLDITPAPLTVTVSAQNKLYNGNTTAAYTLSTNANGDIVNLALQPAPNTGTATFATPNVGNGITVTVGPLYITNGANAGNWYLPVANDTVTTTANITTTPQTWNGNDYIANTISNWSDGLNWVSTSAPDLAGDSLDFTGAQGQYPLMQGAYTNWSLIFDSSATIPFIITNTGVTGAAALSMGAGGITNNSALTQTICVPVSNLTSFSSQWYVTGGSSLVMNSNVSDAGGGITLSGSGILNLAGSNNAITGPLTNVSGTLEISGVAKLNNESYAGAINNNGTFIYNSISNQTLSGVISGSGTLIQDAGYPASATSTLTLSGANTFTGPIIIGSTNSSPPGPSNCVVQISADNNLGAIPGSVVANQITISNLGSLRASANVTVNANRGVTLGTGGGGFQVAQNDTLMYPGVISGTGPFYCGTAITVGYGTVELTGANTYTGPTVIACGILELGANNTLPSGTSLTIAAANSVGGTFNMNANSQTIGPLASSTGIGGTGTDTIGVTLTGALTIYETNLPTSFNGVISGAGGSLTVTVPGGGTGSELTLLGTNTYSGATTVSSGATLGLAVKGAISNSTSITIGPGGTLDPSGLTVATYFLSASQTLTASGTGAAPAIIKGNASGVVNAGAQGITLNYTPTAFTGDSSDPALTISQGTLSVNGNAITVNNMSATALGNGVYVVIQTPGAITQVAAPTLAGGVVGGMGVGAGGSAVLSVSGNNVIVTVSGVTPLTPPSPQITMVGFSSPGVLSISATNGTPNGPYRLMETTNLAIPVTNWNVIQTGNFDNNGDVTVPYTVNPSDPAEFFSIQNP